MINGSERPRSSPILRLAIEAALIVFVLYSVLLMREFTKSGGVTGKNLIVAIGDIFTFVNLAIAITAASIGIAIIEYLRNRR